MGVSIPTSPGAADFRDLPRKKLQPEWRPDAASDSCLCCGKQFSFLYRRHHCRACGELVCAECSPHQEILPEYGYDAPVRVCKRCNATALFSSSNSSGITYASSEASSDSEFGDADDDELIPWAIDVIASHSTHKHSKLSYEYFVQSEAVNWLVDAGVVKNRSCGAALFHRLVDEAIVSMKPWSGSSRTAFYILSDDACLGPRLSQYDRAMHSETGKCNNCAQSFMESLTPAPGFCSIDCKTNSLISQADSARIRRML